MEAATLIVMLNSYYDEYMQHKEFIASANKLRTTTTSHTNALTDSQRHCLMCSRFIFDTLVLAFTHPRAVKMCDVKADSPAETLIEFAGTKARYHIIRNGEKVYTLESMKSDDLLARLFGKLCDVLRDVTELRRYAHPNTRKVRFHGDITGHKEKAPHDGERHEQENHALFETHSV